MLFRSCREAFTMAEVQRVEIGTSALCDFFENSRIDASFSGTGRRFNKHLVMILENLDRFCDRTLLNSSDLIEIDRGRSEEQTSELQSLMRISYAVFCLKKKNRNE